MLCSRPSVALRARPELDLWVSWGWGACFWSPWMCNIKYTWKEPGAPTALHEQGVGWCTRGRGHEERRGHQCFLSGWLLWHYFKQSLALSLSPSVPTLVIVQSQLDCNWSFFSFMGLSLSIYTSHHCSLKLHVTNVSIRQVPDRLSFSTCSERCGVGRSHS